MGIWNLYFLLKLYLFHIGRIAPIWLPNILLALLLVLPIRNRLLSVARQLVAVIAGSALLYREGNFPPFLHAVSQVGNLRSFTPGYLLELSMRLVSLDMLYVAAVGITAYLILNRWMRVTTLVLAALLAIPLWQGLGSLGGGATRAVAGTALPDAGTVAVAASGAAAASGPEGQLAAFRQEEASRVVNFGKLTATSDTQFDILFIHVCSLSWDDIDESKARNNPLLSRFDYLFTNFSSAASYSGPAAIRLLRANCGQEPHKALYDPAPEQCHLFPQLAQAGFGAAALLNHGGEFDHFRSNVVREIGIPGVEPPSNDGLPVVLRAFDNSAVAGDFDVISRWYKGRLQQDKGPMALYYNTVSLHDGNRIVGSSLGSLESYPQRLTKLLGDVDKVIDMVASSGRRAVIVFVPEHGGALRGDHSQIAGLREIPTPGIIHIPVGVKLVGLPVPNQQQTTIDTPTSFLALAQLIGNLIATNPFGAGAPAPAQYAADLPQTMMVGENEGTITIKEGKGFAMRSPDGVWMQEQP